MGWSVGFDATWNRDIGYGVPAYCDHPGCDEEIDRGLSYVCANGQAYGGQFGCGLYFCGKHRNAKGFCGQCSKPRTEPFDAKRDHPDWIRHKLLDPTWAEWRCDNEEWVARAREWHESQSE